MSCTTEELPKLEELPTPEVLFSLADLSRTTSFGRIHSCLTALALNPPLEPTVQETVRTVRVYREKLEPTSIRRSLPPKTTYTLWSPVESLTIRDGLDQANKNVVTSTEYEDRCQTAGFANLVINHLELIDKVQLTVGGIVVNELLSHKLDPTIGTGTFPMLSQGQALPYLRHHMYQVVIYWLPGVVLHQDEVVLQYDQVSVASLPDEYSYQIEQERALVTGHLDPRQYNLSLAGLSVGPVSQVMAQMPLGTTGVFLRFDLVSQNVDVPLNCNAKGWWELDSRTCPIYINRLQNVNICFTGPPDNEVSSNGCIILRSKNIFKVKLGMGGVSFC